MIDVEDFSDNNSNFWEHLFKNQLKSIYFQREKALTSHRIL